MNGEATRLTHLPVRRILPIPAAVLIAAVLLLAAPASQSSAQEEESSISGTLSQAIEDYLNAQDELASLKTEQGELETELEESQVEVVELQAELEDFAYIAATTSELQSTTALMASGEPTELMHAMTMLDFLGDSRAQKITELTTRLAEIEATQETLADNIADQADLTETLETARNAAAQEMASSGGDDAVGPSPGDFPTPEPAPRESDGSLPWESCSEDDPTPANGCITPRTLHALEQAQIAGFTRYVSCYRSGGSGEHPKGRACDFSSEPGRFGGDASGDDRTYGDNLAAWFVENWKELGVQYVIWYRQFWSPSTGWKSYSGAYGDPSSDHTNHVHLSMR